MNRRDVHNSGFTLVELLVVIAIISILAGMLLPALESARLSAQSATCLNNIKQTFLALTMYGDDNDGRVSTWSSTNDYWSSQLLEQEYAPVSSRICPLQTTGNNEPEKNPAFVLGLCMEGPADTTFADSSGGGRVIDTSSIPSALPMLGDSVYRVGDANLIGRQYCQIFYMNGAYASYGFHLRHCEGLGVNVGFFDGHAQSMFLNDLANANAKAMGTATYMFAFANDDRLTWTGSVGNP